MAKSKYEEYLEKYGPKQTVTESIDAEIEDAGVQQAARQVQSADELPERFQGKSAAEIARSYTELESLYGKQSETVGQQRKQIDQLFQLNEQGTIVPDEKPPQEKVPVDVDALYDDADGAIRRVVREEADERVAELEQRVASFEEQARVSSLDAKHPGWRETAASPEFATWAQEQPYRLRMVHAAYAGDTDAADDVLSMYADASGSASVAQADLDRQQALKNATLTSPQAPSTNPEAEEFSRSALLDTRIRAKKGDSEAENWLVANAESIRQAYAEGRITD